MAPVRKGSRVAQVGQTPRSDRAKKGLDESAGRRTPENHEPMHPPDATIKRSKLRLECFVNFDQLIYAVNAVATAPTA